MKTVKCLSIQNKRHRTKVKIAKVGRMMEAEEERCWVGKRLVFGECRWWWQWEEGLWLGQWWFEGREERGCRTGS